MTDEEFIEECKTAWLDQAGFSKDSWDIYFNPDGGLEISYFIPLEAPHYGYVYIVNYFNEHSQIMNISALVKINGETYFLDEMVDKVILLPSTYLKWAKETLPFETNEKKQMTSDQFVEQVKRAWADMIGAPANIWSVTKSGEITTLRYEERLNGNEGLLVIENRFNSKTQKMSIFSTIEIYSEGTWTLDEEVPNVEQLVITWYYWIQSLFG